jgi:hypothetical protein
VSEGDSVLVRTPFQPHAGFGGTITRVSSEGIAMTTENFIAQLLAAPGVFLATKAGQLVPRT